MIGGRFYLFSDTSETVAWSIFNQKQNGTPKSIGYAGKGLPPATANYSIRELELLDLCVNVSLYKHLHAKVSFNCALDHLELTCIMERKIWSSQCKN